jgi:branched-chain amino acid transport system permease protein
VTSPPTVTQPATAASPGEKRTRRRGRAAFRGALVAVGVLIAGLSVPYVIPDRFTVAVLLDGVVLALLALGIGFLARHLGLISLGHGAIFGGAAYSFGIATTHWGLGPYTAAGVALAAGLVLSAVMGLLVVRATGMGFLMLTLALGQALHLSVVQPVARPWTGAHDGLQIDHARDATFLGMGPAELMNPALFWPLPWAVLVLAALALWLVGRSRFGLVLAGIRENEERMRFSGYDTVRPRLAAFVLSGAVAALGGALFALNAGYVSPEVLGFVRAGDSLIAAIIGGVGSIVGPVLGSLLYIGAQAHLNVGGNLALYTGAALILVLVVMPGGITGAAGKAWRRIRGAR